MKKKSPKRIAIIGLPGSGKSTFANTLGKALDLPVYHLDKYVFKDAVTKRNREEFLTRQKELVAEEAWVIEGCSLSTLEMRFSRADVVLYFQLPRFQCVWRLFKRMYRDKHLVENTGCAQAVKIELLRYTFYFEENKGKGIRQLQRQYSDVDFRIFRKSQEVELYLEELFSGKFLPAV